MRLWTLHPKYLDPKGLTALWREALLAQKVLKGETRGYKNHPQLTRFKQQPDPLASIAAYLHAVYEDAVQRGYQFDRTKISVAHQAPCIPTTTNQVAYEWKHLKAKLRVRNRAKYRELLRVRDPEPHPLFTIQEGDVETWEVRK
jgi:hypothetical protein